VKGLRVVTLRAAIIAMAIGASVVGVQAHANLLTDGDFSGWTGDAIGGGINSTNLPGWTTTGYNILYTYSGNAADTIGVDTVTLWGPDNGTNNGFSYPPGQLNFVGMDGDYNTGPLSQTLNGLHAGEEISVSFYYGFGQQEGYDGVTSQQLQVSLGNETLTVGSGSTCDYLGGQNPGVQFANNTQPVGTSCYTNPDKGFSGWTYTTLNFTATGPSEDLSFLPWGNLQIPPFALLAGVVVNPVPEPASMALLGVGIVGVAAAYRRRRRAA
jgi:PEP-CTERM motif